MKKSLSPKERIKILSRRIDNLRKGSGDYNAAERSLAVRETEEALCNAVHEYEGARR